MAKQDMFGMGADDDQDGDEMPPFVILQVMPAEGWRAVFDDPSVGSTATRTLGLAGFALIEFLVPEPNQLPMRAMRPMAVDEHGQIEDVEFFDDFICIVPPGADPKSHVEYALRTRDGEPAK
jgi:hypothetical protein